MRRVVEPGDVRPPGGGEGGAPEGGTAEGGTAPAKRRSGGRRPASSVLCQARGRPAASHVSQLQAPEFAQHASVDCAPAPNCRVPGCRVELIDGEAFYRRYRVCKQHSMEATVQLAAGLARFCQQCARFHNVSEFDEQRRSCRNALARHRRKRRSSGMRPAKRKQHAQQLDEASTGSGEAAAQAAAEQQQHHHQQQQQQQSSGRYAPPEPQMGWQADWQAAQRAHSALAGSNGGTLGWHASNEDCASSTSGSSTDAEAAGEPSPLPAGQQAAAVQSLAAPPAPLEVAASTSLHGFGSSTLDPAFPAAAAAGTPSRTPRWGPAHPDVHIGPSSTRWAASTDGRTHSQPAQQLHPLTAAPALPGSLLHQPATAAALQQPGGALRPPAPGPTLQPPGSVLPELHQLEMPVLHPRSFAPVGRVPSAFARSGGFAQMQQRQQQSPACPAQPPPPPPASSRLHIFGGSFDSLNRSGSDLDSANLGSGMGGAAAAAGVHATRQAGDPAAGAAVAAAAQRMAAAATVALHHGQLEEAGSASLQGFRSGTLLAPAVPQHTEPSAEVLALLHFDAQLQASRAGWAAGFGDLQPHSHRGQLQQPVAAPGAPLQVQQRPGQQQPEPARSLTLLHRSSLPSSEMVFAERGGFGQWQQQPQACPPAPPPRPPMLVDARSFGGSFNSSSSAWSSASLAPAASASLPGGQPSLPAERSLEGGLPAWGSDGLPQAAPAGIGLPGGQPSLRAEGSLDSIPAWGSGSMPLAASALASLLGRASGRPHLQAERSLDSEAGLEGWIAGVLAPQNP
ncbi:hypothetical protein ABPG75_010485 [Micractinium tetrahymenae]